MRARIRTGLAKDARCANARLAVDTAFDAGALANCTIDERGRIIITIAPEDTPPPDAAPNAAAPA